MTCKLEAIFKRQAEFVDSLRPIYRHNEFHNHAFPMPWPINNREFQEEFRLLAWRTTEEVYEAIQVYRVCFDPDLGWHDPEGEAKFREEVADALHFFVELCLAVGITSRDVIFYYEGICVPMEQDALDWVFRFVGSRPDDLVILRWNLFVERLARAMMLLKQRPWRTDDRQTDASRLNGAMASAFVSFISACRRSGINSQNLYDAYFKKGKVNDQRTADQKL